MAVIATDCKSRRGIADFTPAARIACAEKLERDAKRGMNRPLRVMVVGIPNVGKSTLLNRLLRDDKAIVSDVHGTTRDFVEDTMQINGILFRFIDTAGLRDTDDIVENIGIQRLSQSPSFSPISSLGRQS